MLSNEGFPGSVGSSKGNLDSAGCMSFRKGLLGELDSHSEAVNVEVCVWLLETVTCVAFTPGVWGLVNVCCCALEEG